LKLSELRQILPADLILAHTSDQPLQVKENIDLFMRALLEAIILVVLVSLIGFWEWRLALIMALAIPITLAMTFGIADHRAGPSRGRAGGLRRRHQTSLGGRVSAQHCLLAWPDEARHGDLLRH